MKRSWQTRTVMIDTHSPKPREKRQVQEGKVMRLFSLVVEIRKLDSDSKLRSRTASHSAATFDLIV